jgi:group I intron endonuclease
VSEKIVGYVYLITNNVNGKVYIGQTTASVKRRWTEHKCNAKQGVQTNLYSAIRKYGHAAFSIEVLHKATSSEELNRLEIQEIASRQSMESSHGYNLTAGGGGVRNYHFSASVRRVISETSRARWADPRYRKRLSSKKRAFYATEEGKASHASSVGSFVRTDEYKQKHRVNSAALWKNEEYVAKQKAGMARANTDEYRLKQSVNSKRNWSDPEWKARQAAERRARWTPEYRARQIESRRKARELKKSQEVCHQ